MISLKVVAFFVDKCKLDIQVTSSREALGELLPQGPNALALLELIANKTRSQLLAKDERGHTVFLARCDRVLAIAFCLN